MSSKNILESIVITVDPNLLATSVATFQLKDGNFLHIQADMRGADGGRPRHTFVERVTATIDRGNTPFGYPSEVSYIDTGDRVTIYDAACSNYDRGMSSDDTGMNCLKNGRLVQVIVKRNVDHLNALLNTIGCLDCRHYGD